MPFAGHIRSSISASIIHWVIDFQWPQLIQTQCLSLGLLILDLTSSVFASQHSPVPSVVSKHFAMQRPPLERVEMRSPIESTKPAWLS